jgi:hypothetical protein
VVRGGVGEAHVVVPDGLEAADAVQGGELDEEVGVHAEEFPDDVVVAVGGRPVDRRGRRCSPTGAGSGIPPPWASGKAAATKEGRRSARWGAEATDFFDVPRTYGPVYLTYESGLLTYHGFLTITSSSRIISRD